MQLPAPEFPRALRKHVDTTKWTLMDFYGKYRPRRVKAKHPVPGTAIQVQRERDDALEARRARHRRRMEDIHKRAEFNAHVQTMKTALLVAVRHEATVNKTLGECEDTAAGRMDLLEGIEAQQRASEHGNKPAGDGWAAAVPVDHPLFRAVMDNQLHQVQLLLTEASRGVHVNVRDDVLGNTALHKAVALGLPHMVRLLLKRGANVNAANKLGYAPLHFAWRSWDRTRFKTLTVYVRMHSTVLMVRDLREAGAALEAPDRNGDTPLHLAARHGPVRVVQALLEEHVDLHMRNLRGQTPHDVATEAGQEQTELIFKHWEPIVEAHRAREFRKQWSDFLSDKDSTLSLDPAADIIADQRCQDRTNDGERYLRGGFYVVDPPKHEEAEAEAAAARARKAEALGRIRREERAAQRSGLMRNSRRPASMRPLGVSIKDYMYFDANPGFTSYVDADAPSRIDEEANKVAAAEANKMVPGYSRRRSRVVDLEELDPRMARRRSQSAPLAAVLGPVDAAKRAGQAMEEKKKLLTPQQTADDAELVADTAVLLARRRRGVAKSVGHRRRLKALDAMEDATLQRHARDRRRHERGPGCLYVTKTHVDGVVARNDEQRMHLVQQMSDRVRNWQGNGDTFNRKPLLPPSPKTHEFHAAQDAFREQRSTLRMRNRHVHLKQKPARDPWETVPVEGYRVSDHYRRPERGLVVPGV